MKKTIYLIPILFVIGMIYCKPNNKKSNYLKNKLINNDTIYYKNGKVKTIYYYNKEREVDSLYDFSEDERFLGKGLVKDSVLYYSRNDKTSYEGGYFDRKLNGVIRFFNSRNKLTASETFVNGIKHGASILFKDNRPNFIIHYENGIRGLIIMLSDEGRINYIRSDKFEKKFTQTARFYDNGRLEQLDYLVNGKSDGWTYLFKKNDSLFSKILYSKGKIIKKN